MKYVCIIFNQTQIAHTENTLKDLKKEYLITMVLNFQNDKEKLLEKFCQPFDTLFNAVDNLPSNLDQVESSFHRVQKGISSP